MFNVNMFNVNMFNVNMFNVNINTVKPPKNEHLFSVPNFSHCFKSIMKSEHLSKVNILHGPQGVHLLEVLLYIPIRLNTSDLFS